jgi:hypothetical protein
VQLPPEPGRQVQAAAEVDPSGLVRPLVHWLQGWWLPPLRTGRGCTCCT